MKSSTGSRSGLVPEILRIMVYPSPNLRRAVQRGRITMNETPQPRPSVTPRVLAALQVFLAVISHWRKQLSVLSPCYPHMLGASLGMQKPPRISVFKGSR